MSELKIGLIGLDTSHVPAFTKLLNDSSQEYHVPGGRVVAAFPGGSPDFALSRDRVEGFTNEIRDNYGVQILDSAAAVAEAVDAVLLTAVDGRAHLDLFREIAPFKRPTFIDKPFTTSTNDATGIVELADENHIPLLSCSSLRFAQPFVDAMESIGKENVLGGDFSGPMNLEPTQPGLFWYGIHAVEIMFAALGKGCVRVTATTNENNEFVVGEWEDGRIGTVRGNRYGVSTFGALLQSKEGFQFVDAYKHPKPGYAGLLENAMPMFQGGEPPIDIEETLQIVRFIEAANESRGSGQTVAM